MKLIKKIAAIMFAFMMVVSMSCHVKADEGTTPETTGTLTINYVKENQKYKLYKILDLESFSGQNYSYKVAEGWEKFFSTGEGKNYININENNYAEWNATKDDATYRVFAQKALEYANNTEIITPVKTYTTSKGQTTITETGLTLGYYLLDSSVGTLCSLSSSQPNVIINEKNGVPTVEKTIGHGGKIDNTKKSNSANIGETIAFETKINVSNGAKNYVLHDQMDSNLKLFIPTVEGTGPVNITANKLTVNPVYNTDYFVDTNINDSCKCTFHVRFSEGYLNKIDDTVVLTCHYYATLLDGAEINKEMVNQTWLTYGENNTESNRSETKTYTFGIPVLKYTEDVSKPLAGAKFKLYTDPNCNDDANALKFKLNEGKYRYDSTNGEYVLTSLNGTGHIDVEGLEAGTYYLKEIEAPKGYNLLAKAIKVTITDNGQVQVEEDGTEKNVDRVDVENKTGTVLPSTGGAGTTMIYLIGGAFVLGSGVVLVTKRRVKGK